MTNDEQPKEAVSEQQYTLALPWCRPPRSLNQRLHWSERQRLDREIRTTVGWLSRQARIPRSKHATVTLYWAPGDRRKRDADNVVPTLKAGCDGIVDSGVVADDRPELMTKHMPVIVPPPHPPGMWLTVSVRT